MNEMEMTVEFVIGYVLLVALMHLAMPRRLLIRRFTKKKETADDGR